MDSTDQNSKKDVYRVKDHLQDKVIRRGSLMEGADGDLLVIIGNDDGGRGEEAPWEDYFTVFEWRRDKLEEVTEIDWTRR